MRFTYTTNEAKTRARQKHPHHEEKTVAVRVGDIKKNN